MTMLTMIRFVFASLFVFVFWLTLYFYLTLGLYLYFICNCPCRYACICICNYICICNCSCICISKCPVITNLVKQRPGLLLLISLVACWDGRTEAVMSGSRILWASSRCAPTALPARMPRRPHWSWSYWQSCRFSYLVERASCEAASRPAATDILWSSTNVAPISSMMRWSNCSWSHRQSCLFCASCETASRPASANVMWIPR